MRSSHLTHLGYSALRAYDPCVGLGDASKFAFHSAFLGVSNGTRTRDILDHNQVLYQLSYTHHALHRT